MTNLSDIRHLINSDNIEDAISALNNYITENPKSDEAYYLLGNMYRKSNDWRNAIRNYCEAMELNPNSQAKDAYEACIEILNFYNTDLFNP
ncbi:MAG: tetratricopeptide repeat protein [Bacteroidales bacterium]